MRVMMTVSNWLGHYCSMVPTAWALQAAGHEVHVVCAPDQQRNVMQAGLLPVPVLDGVDLALLARMTLVREAREAGATGPDLPLHPVTGRQLTSLDEVDFENLRDQVWREWTAAAGASHDAAVAHARSWRPHLILHDFFSTEGRLAAAVCGIPVALNLWGPFGSAETDSGFAVTPRQLDPFDIFARYGVEEPTPEGIETVIDPCAASMAPPCGTATRLPVRYVPYNGPGAVGRTWSADGPGGPRRVCVIWGTSASRIHGVRRSPLPMLIDELGRRDTEVILTAAPEALEALEALEAVPDNVQVRDSYPLHLLLRRADLCIHHGSSNCAMTAAWAGVPQLALAMSAEQVTNAVRFDLTGASLSLPGNQCTRADVERVVGALLTDLNYPAAAGRLAAEMGDRPSPAQLVPRLEELAGLGRPGGSRTGRR